MSAGTTKKPQLKSWDELFSRGDEQKEMQIPTIEIASLTPYRGHRFQLYDGERLDDMVVSIKKNGILVPVIIRKIDNLFEILAGHNRVNAGTIAGLKRVPMILLENISDDEALVYVVETNLIQRGFSELSHSDKAAVIAAHHSKLFSQGKRNDIIEKLESLENSHSKSTDGTCAQNAHRLKSRDMVAREYDLSRDAVARYLRINLLIQPLKARLDRSELPLIPAVNLSYLKETEQILLDKSIDLNNFKINMKKADLLRQYSKSGKLNEDTIYLILAGEIRSTVKKRSRYSFKIKPAIYKKYFTDQQNSAEIEAIIEKALAFYFQKSKETTL